MSHGTVRPFAEEIANCATHGVGLILSIAGLTALVIMTAHYGDAWRLVSCTVFGASLVALYAASTLYHGFRNPRLKEIFRVVDHSCIYLLVAGTYTPITLTHLRGGWGWTLFGLVWGCAAVGLCVKLFAMKKFNALSTLAYVLMGWLAVIAIKPMIEHVPTGCLVWLLVGGLFYTFGVIFYALDRKPYFHTIWHMFVLAGSIAHFCAVALYILPQKA